MYFSHFLCFPRRCQLLLLLFPSPKDPSWHWHHGRKKGTFAKERERENESRTIEVDAKAIYSNSKVIAISSGRMDKPTITICANSRYSDVRNSEIFFTTYVH